MNDKLRDAAQAALEELIASESNAWNIINDLEAALAETQMPTKIFGPNLVGILNAAGFYRKKEWIGLTEDDDLNNMRYKAKYRYETKQPLTEGELKQCSYDADGFMISREDAMRAVERAHGIGVEDELESSVT